ncbi:MAG: MBL fold metallo-hydrolase [Desulfobacteraceae bacterium]|nr:MAG: MBL fold metallo-hydrolase [Desulfobacteraceae bacterium]
MKTIVTILCDNYVGKSGLIGEHGFCVMIERGNEKYLWDTSPGMSSPHNLKALGKNLKGLNGIVLSHGNYDHTGGLKWAVQESDGLKIVAHSAVFSQHMALNRKDPSEAPHYVGCSYSRQELEELGAAFHFVKHTKEIYSGIRFLAEIDRIAAQLPTDPYLVIPKGNKFVSDPMEDDASLLLEIDGSPILLLGCAHAGVLNILDHVKHKMGIHKLSAVLGGTHLMFSDTDNIQTFMDRLEEFSVDMIGVSHCTGFKAAGELAHHFGNRFVLGSAGSVLTF